MLESISYLEIRCNYNRIDLMTFIGPGCDIDVRRVVTYRCRRYYLSYDANAKEFFIMNARNVLIANIRFDVFKFYVCRAPEIGLNLIWGLLAKLNIYPVKCS